MDSAAYRGANALAVLQHLQTTTGKSWGYPIQIIDTINLAAASSSHTFSSSLATNDGNEEDEEIAASSYATPPFWEYNPKKAVASTTDEEIGLGHDATSCILEIKSGPDYRQYVVTQFVRVFNEDIKFDEIHLEITSTTSLNKSLHLTKRVALFVGVYRTQEEAERQLLSFQVYLSAVGNLHACFDVRLAKFGGKQMTQIESSGRTIEQLRLGLRPCGGPGCAMILSTHRCAGCVFTYYCSKKCQKDGWKDHKIICKKEQKKKKLIKKNMKDVQKNEKKTLTWLEEMETILFTSFEEVPRGSKSKHDRKRWENVRDAWRQHW